MPTPFALYCLAAATLLVVAGLLALPIALVTVGALFELAVFASAGVVPDTDAPVAGDAELGIDDGPR